MVLAGLGADRVLRSMSTNIRFILSYAGEVVVFAPGGCLVGVVQLVVRVDVSVGGVPTPAIGVVSGRGLPVVVGPLAP